MSAWTEERDAVLARFAAEGKSATLAGEALGVSRSAAIARGRHIGVKFHSINVTPLETRVHSQRESLVDQVFGRLTVIERRGSTAEGASVWACRCACGTVKELRRDSLIGGTKSCGCMAGRRDGMMPAASKTPKHSAPWRQSGEAAPAAKARHPVVPMEIGVEPLRIGFMEQRAGACHWPIGDPRHDDFCFCGLPTAFERVYCAQHAKIAYQSKRAG